MSVSIVAISIHVWGSQETFFLKQHTIPQPHLIEHKSIVVDNKKCELFKYDVSSDTQEVKKLREQLFINGFYISIDSDISLCYEFNEYIQSSPADICLFRLLASIASLENSGNNVSNQSLLENAYIQLIWEVESVLPEEIDNDENIRNEENFFRHLFVKFFLEFNTIVKELLWQYLLIWKRYTARFQNNKALAMAITDLELTD